MEVIKDWDLKLEIVKTKRGVLLYKINIDDNHFFLEQNPLKDSKYGYAYRKIKENYPEFYMFWEIKNNKYTGRLLTGVILDKSSIDKFITDILKDDIYKKFTDEKDEIEK
ncbi:MAG: hypothetical protein DSY66_00715 [Persephonella sp.]|nr:MAG: hypothetical protein DSY66_00715 [Persephonella sp.]